MPTQGIFVDFIKLQFNSNLRINKRILSNKLIFVYGLMTTVFKNLTYYVSVLLEAEQKIRFQ